MSPYREPWGGYDPEPPIETPEQMEAHAWAAVAADDWVSKFPELEGIGYTHAYILHLGHLHGRHSLWRDR